MTVTVEPPAAVIHVLTLLEEPQVTLVPPRRRAGLVARSLSITMDTISTP